MKGWIKIHRQIQEHWIFSDSDYFKWWIDILLEVNHSPAKVLIKGSVFICDIGQKLYSLDTWAKRWKCNKSKARRFLKLLENDSMIELINEKKTTRLIVCNYESYQVERNADETQTKRKRNANETQMKPIKEEEEEKEEKETINWELLLIIYNEKFGRKTKVVPTKTKRQIKDRLKEGYSKDDFVQVMDNARNDQYHIDNNYKYLTLEFLTRSDKFERYVQNHNYKIKFKSI